MDYKRKACEYNTQLMRGLLKKSSTTGGRQGINKYWPALAGSNQKDTLSTTFCENIQCFGVVTHSAANPHASYYCTQL